MSTSIAPVAGKYDLSYDFLLWLVSLSTDFLNGEDSSNEHVAGKLKLYVQYNESLPENCATINADNIGPPEGNDFVPTLRANFVVLVRMEDTDTNSGRARVAAACKAIVELLQTDKMQPKTHVTFPSGRTIYNLSKPRTLRGSLDEAGRAQSIVEFQALYRDELFQTT